MKHFFSLNIDFVGFFTSSLCALHCAALPILLGFGVISTEWMDHLLVEIIFLSLSLVFAVQSLHKSYKNVHNDIRPMSIAGVGFAIFIIGLQFHGPVEIVCTTCAGILIASAHVINWRIVRSKRTELCCA